MDTATCLIDGSHQRVTEFDYLIVRHAIKMHHFRLETEDAELFQRAERDAFELVSDLSPADCAALTWLAEAAVEYMNDHTMNGTFYVEDSCLWCEPDEDWASEQQAAYDDHWR